MKIKDINKPQSNKKYKNIKIDEEEIKRKKEKQRKILILLGLLITTATFIIADLYYGSNRPHPNMFQQTNPIDVSFVMKFELPDTIFLIKNFTNEYNVIVFGKYFDWTTLQTIKNMSLKGIGKTEIDFVEDKGYIFKFKVNKTNLSFNITDEEIIDDIFNNLRFMLSIENKNAIYGGYEGYIYGLPEKVYVLALPTSANQGFVKGNLYSTNISIDNSPHKIGIQSNIVEGCGNVSAKVINISSINIEGEIYDSNVLSMENITISSIENPKVNITSDANKAIKNLVEKFNPLILKDNMTNITIMKFNNFTLTLTNISYKNVSQNTTIKILNFEYNSTKSEIESILKDANLTYKIIPGRIKILVKAENWNNYIYQKINNSIINPKIEKQGTVRVPNVCIVEKKILFIPNNENFNAILDLDTKIDDAISVTIVYYSITGGGEEKMIPYIATENKNVSQIHK